MKIPFKIFPSVGYKNSQFQVVSSVDNLQITIYDNKKIIKSVVVNSKYPILLTSLNKTGKLIAKCKFDNIEYQQELVINEAFRLGSSEFKKAFVFDDTDYSFFLMKDRLLLYDEKKKILLTENHYSPTEIHKINSSNFLFVTKLGNSSKGIINLGIYNTDSFSLVGELLNDYREIKILPDINIAWLYNIKSKTIHCFELANEINRYFTELKIFKNFDDFFLDSTRQNIYINYFDSWRVSNLNNLHNSIKISNEANNAVDKFGNVFTLENNILICTSLFTNYLKTLKLDFKVNFQDENFIHLGSDLKSIYKLADLSKIAEEIKDEYLDSLSEDKSYHFQLLSEDKKISETYTFHEIYPTSGGVFIIEKRIKRDFNGLTFRKCNGDWTVSPNKIEFTEFALLLFNAEKVDLILDKSPNLTVIEYENPMLLLESNGSKLLFSGSNRLTIDNDDTIELFTINQFAYSLIKSNEKWSLFEANNFEKAILEQIEILNPDLFEKHKKIWFRGKEKFGSKNKYLNAFDLENMTTSFIDEQKMQHSQFKDAFDINFFEKYALSSNQIVFSPITFEVKDAFIGSIESHSRQLNKIVSHRTNIIYLSIFNTKTRKFESSKVSVDYKKFRESYLSPDGQYLVLQDENNKYSFYDIEKSETIKFISGNFLAFKEDGSLIVEQDGNRAVKIIDPKTFEDITPPNYHHYEFMSPDGKLYAKVSLKSRYFHKLNGKELKLEEVNKIRQELDTPNYYYKEKAKLTIEKNRKKFFETFKNEFKVIGIKDYNKISSQNVVRVEKFTEIGITGTNVTSEVIFPEDLKFYNYSAFSYDNKYFGYVGKPSSNGLIHLFKIDFDEVNYKLTVNETYLSRYPRKASWVCGFSKTGYFATYDSTPFTYIVYVDDNLFISKPTEGEISQNILKSNSNIYKTYKKWNEIRGKNFLCFSPSGDYLALSEQGYEPLTLGGYGHQESNVVHIAKTTNGQILDSFTGHGDQIKDNRTKKVVFVAFSEDESRIMTLSADGVVIIRDISIHDDVKGVGVPDS